MTAFRSPAKSLSPPTSPYQDQRKLFALQLMLCARMPELFEALDVSLSHSKKAWYGCCQIHGGDNPSALNIYRDGDSVPGYWYCLTRHCEKTFKSTIVGFVRGALSRHRYDWSGPQDQTVGWKEAVDWCCRFLGTPIQDLHVDEAWLDSQRFAAGINTFLCRPPKPVQGVPRDKVRRFLQIPATYFLGRGYSSSTLDHFDVGYYPVENRPLSGRVAVPIYDETGRIAVGFTGRSVHPKCGECGRWHGGECPTTPEALTFASKWLNQGFDKSNYLYNWWHARHTIAARKVAVLCEGPGEVWRLSEAGIDVGLAMFGTTLSDKQQVLLETSGAMDLVIATNNDEAGRLAGEELRRGLGRIFRVHLPTLPKADLGEMTPQEVSECLGPFTKRRR